MSTRVHVATKYEVEYSTYGDFKYNYPDFYRLLQILSEDDGGEIYYNPDDSATVCEVDRSLYEKCIYKLEHYSDFDAKMKDRVCNAIMRIYDYSFSESEIEKYLKQVIESMRMFLGLSSETGSIIYFCAY